MLRLDSVTINIYIDASPQWKGLELFAGSFDLIVQSVGHYSVRRYFPQVRIGPYLFNLWGKTFALLWMIWLLVGPTFEACRAFCGRVRFITSDYGTEHKMIDVADCLIDFFKFIGKSIPKTAKALQHLFPMGCIIPGWHHLFDGVIRWGLFTLPWFPHFLLILKAYIKFGRNYLHDFLKDLTDAGLSGAAGILRRIVFVTFAEWRWRKLYLCCKSVGDAMLTLLNTQVLPLLRVFLTKLKDTKMARLIISTFNDAVFRIRFEFVRWYSSAWQHIEGFASSCWCHHEEWLAGTSVVCAEKGRLLPYCYDFAIERMNAMTATADSWVDSEWGGPQACMQLRGCVYASISRAKAKIQVFDDIPLLFSRLGYEPGIRAKCLKPQK